MTITNRLILAGIVMSGLSGCATVINGTSQDYSIQSEPSGAKVRLTSGAECTTPCELNLKRRHDFRADISRDGFQPAYVLVQSRTGGAAVGNILLGGLVGGVVDGSNGACNHLFPQPLSIKLAPLDSNAEAELLDRKGKVTGTVFAHNKSVRGDVAKTIGVEAAGVDDNLPATPTAAPAVVAASASPPADPSAPQPAVSPEPAVAPPASASPAETPSAAPIAVAPAGR